MNFMTRFTGTAIFVAALSTTGSFAAEANLIFNTFLSPFDPSRKVAVDDFSARIEKESGGTIKVTIPDASLASTSDQYGMLIDGVADMALVATPDIAQLVKLNGIADLPGNVTSATAASVALWETYNKYFKELDEYKGLHLLSVHVLSGRQLMGIGDHPVDSLEAVAGTKMWVPNGPLTDIVEALDAVPIHVSFPELASGAETGLFDTLVATPGTLLAARIIDKAEHLTKFPGGLGSVSLAVVITNDAWDGLSKEQQAAVERAAEGLPARTGGAMDGLEAGGMGKMTGKSIVAASDELIEALRPTLEEQTTRWKAEALEAGIEDPDAVLEFYHSVLQRESAK